MAHDHEGREHISRGACRHRACYKSGESPRLERQVDELGGRGGVGAGLGGVKGEVQEGGWVGRGVGRC